MSRSPPRQSESRALFGGLVAPQKVLVVHHHPRMERKGLEASLGLHSSVKKSHQHREFIYTVYNRIQFVTELEVLYKRVHLHCTSLFIL